MKNFKNLSKRALALFVSTMMCMGILRVDALAAITVEYELTCTQEEHTHTDECYGKAMDCGLEEAEGHRHADECYGMVEALVCGQEEEEGYHVHDLSCLDENGAPTQCTHGGEYTGHIHTSECYGMVRGELNCVEPEVEGHTHSDSCYKTELTCEQEEHTHTSACGGLKQSTQVTTDENGNETTTTGAVDIWSALGGTDKDVTLILNGYVLELDATHNSVRVDGKNLTIQDALESTTPGGTIKGDGKNHVITIVNGGNVTLSGSTVITGGSGGVLLQNTGSTFNMNGGEISGNTTEGGVTLRDKNWKGENIGGGTFNMTDGTISGNTHVNNGGGVTVNGGTFNMSGGTISDNTASEGGGVFINQGSNFEMTGGTVDGNTALVGEGGGIYVSGNATITKGQITNNETKTQSDLGGGGIYIETTGKLNLKNAIITDNYAAGLGGGLAACVHGKTVVYVDNGAIIFGNHSEGNSYSQGHDQSNGTTNGSKIDGHAWWWGNNTFENSAQDIFAASDSRVDDWTTDNYGVGGIYVSNTVLGGGDADWSGYVFAYDQTTGELIRDEDGNPACLPVDTDGSVIYSGKLLGLTAAPSFAVIEAAEAAAREAGGGVLISGNKSATHGGGIGNNGLLVIGDGEFEETEGKQDLDLKKELETPEDSDRVLQENEFSFVVTDENGNEISAGRNDINGDVNIDFPEGTFTEGRTYTFYVKEEIPEGALYDEATGTYYTADTNGNRIIYDSTVYMVVVEVTENVEKVLLGDPDSEHGAEEITLRTLTVGDPSISKVVLDESGNPLLDEDGNPVTLFGLVNGIIFNNVYDPVEETGDDDDDDDDDDTIPGDDDDDDDDDDTIPGDDDDDDDDDDTIPGDDDDDDDDDDTIPGDDDDDDDDDDTIPGDDDDDDDDDDTIPGDDDDDDDDDDIIPGDDDDDGDDDITPDPTPDPDPTPEPDPLPPTPETPVEETPEVPEVEVPDMPTPLEELPEIPEIEEPFVEMADEPTPLAVMTEEPEEEEEELFEMPEDPVPLSDIPVTGDISALWYAAAALSAAGLLVVLGKKREEEQA